MQILDASTHVHTVILKYPTQGKVVITFLLLSYNRMKNRDLRVYCSLKNFTRSTPLLNLPIGMLRWVFICCICFRR